MIRHGQGIQFCFFITVRIQEPFGEFVSLPSGCGVLDCLPSKYSTSLNRFCLSWIQSRTNLSFLRDRIGERQNICTLCRLIAVIVIIIDIQHSTAVGLYLGGRRFFLQMETGVLIIRLIFN